VRKAMKQVAAAIGTLVAASTLPLLIAAPAQATPYQCGQYLDDHGYVVGPGVVQACSANDSPGSDIGCVVGLMNLKVTQADAEAACNLRMQP
jgi:hypothetical protein